MGGAKKRSASGATRSTKSKKVRPKAVGSDGSGLKQLQPPQNRIAPSFGRPKRKKASSEKAEETVCLSLSPITQENKPSTILDSGLNLTVPDESKITALEIADSKSDACPKNIERNDECLLEANMETHEDMGDCTERNPNVQSDVTIAAGVELVSHSSLRKKEATEKVKSLMDLALQTVNHQMHCLKLDRTCSLKCKAEEENFKAMQNDSERLHLPNGDLPLLCHDALESRSLNPDMLPQMRQDGIAIEDNEVSCQSQSISITSTLASGSDAIKVTSETEVVVSNANIEEETKLKWKSTADGTEDGNESSYISQRDVTSVKSPEQVQHEEISHVVDTGHLPEGTRSHMVDTDNMSEGTRSHVVDTDYLSKATGSHVVDTELTDSQMCQFYNDMDKTKLESPVRLMNETFQNTNKSTRVEPKYNRGDSIINRMTSQVQSINAMLVRYKRAIEIAKHKHACTKSQLNVTR